MSAKDPSSIQAIKAPHHNFTTCLGHTILGYQILDILVSVAGWTSHKSLEQRPRMHTPEVIRPKLKFLIGSLSDWPSILYNAHKSWIQIKDNIEQFKSMFDPLDSIANNNDKRITVKNLFHVVEHQSKSKWSSMITCISSVAFIISWHIPVSHVSAIFFVQC